eukprot:scaffold25382_cov137-Cylindrotheca_fusiformis.AAC.1
MKSISHLCRRGGKVYLIDAEAVPTKLPHKRWSLSRRVGHSTTGQVNSSVLKTLKQSQRRDGSVRRICSFLQLSHLRRRGGKVHLMDFPEPSKMLTESDQ